jgi:hypothetical protein
MPSGVADQAGGTLRAVERVFAEAVRAALAHGADSMVATGIAPTPGPPRKWVDACTWLSIFFHTKKGAV